MTISLKNKQQAPRRSASGDTASTILDIAERLAQTKGYNGFSYADIAEELGVTKASLHYHFPSKAALGRALIKRYESVFGTALEEIDRLASTPLEKLRRYVGLYDGVMRNDRMCLCGMLAAEYATLPASMQAELRRFFDLNERWLTNVLVPGRQSGEFVFKESENERARLILSSLEGAMLVARSYGDPRRFQTAAEYVLEDLSAARQSRRAKRA